MATVAEGSSSASPRPGQAAVGGHVGCFPAKNGRGGDAAVVLPHVGEGSQPVAVTDRIEPAARNADRPQRPVHAYRPSRLQPDMLQADAGGGGPAGPPGPG